MNRGYFPKTLMGMCAVASHKLSTSLKQHGISSRLAVTDNHVWVEVGDICVDVTATQFGKEPIIIMNRKNYMSELNITQAPVRFRNPDIMKFHLAKSGWCFSQIP